MSRFGPDPHAFFSTVYQDVAPWDIGAAQPALMSLVDEFPPSDPILDLGCGSGDLAIALARAGHDVLGIDFVEAAIAQARARQAQHPADAGRLAFAVADALRPSLLGKMFGAITDCGFCHLLEPAACDDLAAEVAAALAPGGRHYILAFAMHFDLPNIPRQITEEELRARFTADRGWRVLTIRSAVFESRIAPVPAIAACVERIT